jgi:putative tricarboxylic transport membrane protein
MSRSTWSRTAARPGWARTAAALAGLALATTACGTTAGDDGDEDTAASGPVSGLRVMVPNSPGSGYDQTARAATKAMEDADLAETVEVFNVAGAGGTVGLQRLVNEKGNGDLLMQMGLGVVGAEFTNKSQATLAETTPIAGLIEEAEVIVVPKDSPYDDLKALTDAWKADPGGLPVGGASNPGGPDHLTPMLLAEEVGVDPTTVNYVPYDGGGELLAGILGKKLAFAATGVSEVAEQAAAGELKILAVTSEEPVEGVDAPTLQDEGIDLTFTNWRGIVAAPDISDADRTRLTDLVTEMHDSAQWQQALEDNGWTDAFMTGDEFDEFLTSESERVKGVLSGLGLA